MLRGWQDRAAPARLLIEARSIEIYEQMRFKANFLPIARCWGVSNPFSWPGEVID